MYKWGIGPWYSIWASLLALVFQKFREMEMIYNESQLFKLLNEFI